MEKNHHIYLRQLKSAKVSNTKPRRAVFEALVASEHKPLSTKELILATSSKADRASVYRSIETLEKAGIIKRIYQGWKYRLELSDVFHGHHHHITCVECGRTEIIKENTDLEELLHKITKKAGFSRGEHNVEIRGICSTCSKSNSV